MGPKKRKGKSYAKRVADINQIYDTYVRTGLPNREIWKRYVYPKYGICERTFYNLLKASSNPQFEERAALSALSLPPERTGYPVLENKQEEKNIGLPGSSYFCCLKEEVNHP